LPALVAPVRGTSPSGSALFSAKAESIDLFVLSHADEGVWSLAKRVLANSCPNDLEELVEDVIYSINRIRASTQKLRGSIVQSELPSFLR
jgi:hypothetical protein